MRRTPPTVRSVLESTTVLVHSRQPGERTPRGHAQRSTTTRTGVVSDASLVFFIVLMLTGSPAKAQVSVVAWANTGEDKVTNDELRLSRSGADVTNSAWDGESINLFGGRNEVVNFNVVLEAPSGATNVSVSFDLLEGLPGSAISSRPTSGNGVFNYVGRNIELFFVRYLQINGLSLVSYGTYDERHIPLKLERPWTGAGESTRSVGGRGTAMGGDSVRPVVPVGGGGHHDRANDSNAVANMGRDQ